MSYFTKVSATVADGDLDLTKHVNFTSGMILGVDDFTQEFAYLAGRDRWLARDALGYGTISGLSVRIEKDAEKGHRVLILPGAAVSPRGQFICVPSAQCAYLNQWLAAARTEDLVKYVKTVVTSSPPAETNEITLFVVLCYRDCATDNVPIPGEPCRSEDELTAASRITDDFSLELRFDAPNQPEETKLREYVEWLKKIKISETDASTPIADFIEAIRVQWLPPASPPITSPPPVLQIQTTDISQYMRTAFRVWITELRGFLSERKTGCAVEMTGGAKLEDCVLLAELLIPLVPISPGWKVSDTKEIKLDEKKRPFLLHLRMLQEWMLYSYEQTLGTAPSPNTPTTLDSLSDVTVPTPADGQILVFEGGEWVAKTPAAGGGAVDHGGLTGLEDDDHQQYLLADGSRALTGNLNGGGKRITNIAAATANGQAVIFQQAIKKNDAAGGDLAGTYPNPTVSQLQGKPVDGQTPNVGDALIWNGTTWTPQPQTVPTPAQPDPFLILPLATITRRDVNIYEIWFNLAASDNLAEIKEVTRANLKIFDETETAPTFLDEIRHASSRIIRNVFNVRLGVPANQPEPDCLRFGFDVNKIKVAFGNEEPTLFEYAQKNNIKFAGSFKDNLAIVFVRGAGRVG